MQVSLDWIKELLPGLKAKPDAVGRRLTAAGIEVDGVTRPADALEGVVAGEVRKLVPHPDADKLRVATVFDGQAEHTVVCGAPNVAEGQKVAFAPVGVTLPIGLTLERRKIRGVESQGMICAEDELGLVDSKSEGIMVLRPRTKPGKKLAQVLKLNDVIFELSITPNRADALSHLGIARELAALYGQPLPKVSTRVREAGKPASSLAKVEIKDGKRCPKYVGRVLTGVKVGPSPLWVQQRLKAVGVRSISNVVDATNLVLMELGHPLHAFDLEKLRQNKIVVRTGKKKEKITLLDGQTIELSEEDLVIADAEVPVALAGVMGGADSEVGEGTTNILLESAMFDPTTVRKTAKRHGLHTEASHRFERGADPSMVEAAIDRCAQLIVELSESGTVHKGRVATVKKEAEPRVVPIRPDRASRVIGRPVGKQEIRDSLTALGLKPAKAKKTASKKKGKKAAPADAMHFRIPSWRVDLAIEEDLIEEVARLGGYDQIPTSMPPTASEVWTEGPRRDHAREVREVLVAEGFLEAVSLAFTSEAVAEDLGLDVSQGVFVENPLGEESQLMRLSTLPALLRATRLNQDNLPSITDLRLFEVGKTFAWSNPPQRLPRETRRVGLLMRGHRAPVDWTKQTAMLDPYDLKAVVEAVLDHFRIRATFEAFDAPWLHPRSSTRIDCEGRTLGLFGEAHPNVMDRYGLDGPPVFLAELDLDAMVHCVGGHAVFVPLPKLPPAQRDLSFYVDRDVVAARVLETIEGAGTSQNLESVRLFDVYEGKGVPEGKKSLAVAMTFRSADRTLTDAEVEAAQAAVVKALQERLGAQIRGG